MIKALIFDLDNTLIDRKKAFIEGLNTILKRYDFEEVLIQKMIEDILIWDCNGAVERIVAFEKLIEKYQLTCCSKEELDLAWKEISGKQCYLFDDVKETLTVLKKKYKIAILSNGNKVTQRRKMATINLYDLLDYSLISGEYICDKPNERIFQYACSQLGLEPSECVYIGDSYYIDIVGSRKAGLQAIYVQRSDEEYSNVQTIKEIRELLELF